MKKLLLVCLLLSTVLLSFAQDTTKRRHDPFLSVGIGWTPNKDLTYSAELGTWGNVSPTSFSLTYDMSRNVSKEALNTNPLFSHWMGIKAYYTVYSGTKICYMFYVKEAIQMENSSNSLLEMGFNPNYTISNNWLLGVTLGNQALAGSQWNLFSSVGFVYLIK